MRQNSKINEAMSQYLEHGNYRVYGKGQILFCILSGQWNLETVLGYIGETKEVVRKLAEKPWGQIVDYNEWQLGVPETAKPAMELQKWLHQQGLKYKAIIVQSELKIDIVKNYVKNYSDIDVEIFREERQAIDWLKTKGITDG